MTVRELIAKLQNLNPDATVCVESWSDPVAKEIYVVSRPEDREYIYLTDDFYHFIADVKDNGYKVRKIN